MSIQTFNPNTNKTGTSFVEMAEFPLVEQLINTQ
jgi:hypothetical protein